MSPKTKNSTTKDEVAVTPAQEIARLAGLPEVHAAFRWFNAHTAEVTERQIEITRIPAPTFRESERAEWFRGYFSRIGLKEVHIDEVGNVLAIRPGTLSDSPYVALTAHLDTVFPPGAKIEVQRSQERLLGPGISDNGAGLAALLAVATALQEAQIRHDAPILFVTNVGEEGEGDLRGIRHLFNQSHWRDAIAHTLVLDGGGTDSIITEGVGSRRFAVKMRGPGGHSWTDYGMPNPIIILSRAIDQFARTPIPHDPRTSLNIGTISGGTSVNSIPESVSMKVDIRSMADDELARLEHALREALAEAAGELKAWGFDTQRAAQISYELQPIGNRPAAVLWPEARILQVIQAVDAQMGITARSQRASTDANIPLSLGKEAIAIGAGGLGGGVHTLQEWYDPTHRELGLRRILLTLLALAGMP